ncbi:MAG: heterocyst differentiation protein HetZ [Moorea sp. SIO2B7]|nr:heterocyst differentiation protein HetZ [Moorena sp. SIO2B7]
MGVEGIFQLLLEQLSTSTRASESNCLQVAERITDEVTRICQQSDRIQASGDVTGWAKTLATHRLKQCLHYYNLGSSRGRIELQSTLSAIVYRYITPSYNNASYQERITLIEDFLQGFYGETLHAWRREANLSPTYSPQTLLELAEYMAFSERYAKRRIPLPRKRSQQLIILRAQTFSQKQPPETSVDLETAAEGYSPNSDNDSNSPTMQQLRSIMADNDNGTTLLEDNLRETVIDELIDYLEDRQQSDCVNYFILRLKDRSANEIEQILGLTARQRDYLQQRFKYHLIRFALSHRWELVHQWLDADLEHNLGLKPSQWELFRSKLNPKQIQLLELKQENVANAEIAQTLSLTNTQLEKQWLKLLEMAWDIRNRSLL